METSIIIRGNSHMTHSPKAELQFSLTLQPSKCRMSTDWHAKTAKNYPWKVNHLICLPEQGTQWRASASSHNGCCIMMAKLVHLCTCTTLPASTPIGAKADQASSFSTCWLDFVLGLLCDLLYASGSQGICGTCLSTVHAYSLLLFIFKIYFWLAYCLK